MSGGIGLPFHLFEAGFSRRIGPNRYFASCVSSVAGSIALSLAYERSGSSAFGRTQERGDVLADGDVNWKPGTLYTNPDDASVLLSGGFGFGWTMDPVRPAAEVIVMGCVVLAVGFCVAVGVLLQP